MDFDWKSIVKSVAPVIGTALGGPLAGTAVKFLAEEVLGNPNASEQEVATAMLGASPDQLLKLKEADISFKTRMEELKVDVYRLEVSDRSSARELAKTNLWPQITLSSVYSVGYFLVLWQFITGGVVIPTTNEALATTLFGVLTAAQIQIMNFWFGSSFGSKVKDTKLTSG